MKTWTLVWFLVLGPNDAGLIEFEKGFESNLTMQQCNAMLRDQTVDYELMVSRKEIEGYAISCNEEEEQD